MAIRAISAHVGWRSMKRVTRAAQPRLRPSGRPPSTGQILANTRPFLPSPCLPPAPRPLLDRVFRILTAPQGLHLIVSIFSRGASRPQDLGGAPIIGRCHSDIGREKAREAALRGEAEIE